MIRLNFALSPPPKSLSPISSATRAEQKTTGRVSARSRMRRYMQSHGAEDPLYDGFATAARPCTHPPMGSRASGSTRARIRSPRRRAPRAQGGRAAARSERRFIDLSAFPLLVQPRGRADQSDAPESGSRFAEELVDQVL